MAYMFKMNSNPPYTSALEDFIIVAPIRALFFFRVTGGRIFSWLAFPWVFISLSKIVKLSILVFLIAAYFRASLVKNMLLKKGSKIISFVATMWLLPTLRLNSFILFYYKSLFYLKILDQGWIEFIGGQGLFSAISKKGETLDLSHLVNVKVLLLLIAVVTLMIALVI